MICPYFNEVWLYISEICNDKCAQFITTKLQACQKSSAPETLHLLELYIVMERESVCFIVMF